MLILGCRQENEEEDTKSQKVIAVVYDYELTRLELTNKLPKTLDKNDSAATAKKITDRWIMNHVMMHMAESEISKDRKKAIQNKVSEYREKLMINAFEQQQIDQRMDTNISEAEMRTFYKQHKDRFTLKDLLVKVMYLKVPVDAPKIERVKKWYQLRDKEDSIRLDNYAKHYALNYYYDQDSWLYLENLKEEVPLENFSRHQIGRLPYKTFISDSSAYYFVHIFDVINEDAAAPMEMQSGAIRQAILTSRIYQLRKKLKKEFVDKAYEENAIQR